MSWRSPFANLEEGPAGVPTARGRREESGEMGHWVVGEGVKIVNREFRQPTCTS